MTVIKKPLSETRPVVVFKAASHSGGAFAILVGCLVLVGWALDISSLSMALGVLLTVVIFSVLAFWNASAQVRHDAERLEAEAELRRSRQMFLGLFESGSDAIVVVNREGQIAQVNRQVEALLGYRREELLGQSVELLVPEHLRGKHVGHRADYNSQPHARPMGTWVELYARRKNGTTVAVDISLSSYRHNGDLFVISSIRDITQRRRMESTLRESQRTFQTLISNLPGMAYRCRNDKDRTLEFTSDGCSDLTGYEPADFGQTKKISYGALIHPDERDKVWDDVQAALKKKTPFQLTYRIIAKSGAEKWVWEKGRGIFSADGNLEALEGFITDITERKQAEENLRSRHQDIQALHKIGQIVINSTDLNDLSANILDKIFAIGAFDLGVIRLLEPTSKSLLPIASRGYPSPATIRPISADLKDPIVGRVQAEVLATKNTYVIESVAASDGLQTFKREGISSAVVVPIRAEDEVVGSIQLGSRTPRKFKPEEIRLLEAIGNQLGIAVQKFRFQEATQKNLERIRALHEINKAIISTLDLRQTLNILLEQIDLFLPYTVTAIRLVNKETGLLEGVACRNLDEAEWKKVMGQYPSRIDSTLSQNNSPIFIRNVQTDSRSLAVDFLKKHGLVSSFRVPLVVKEEALGVITFFTKEEHEFSHEEVEFLTALAGEAAIAIHNSHLYDGARTRETQLREANLMLSALHAVAAAVSQSLELDRVLQAAIEKITEIFRFDATQIHLYNEQADELIRRAAFERDSDRFSSVGSFKKGHGIVGTVAESGKPLVFEDTETDPLYWKLSRSKVSGQFGYHFFAVFPIKSKLKNLGTLACTNMAPRKLNLGEVQLLESLADQIAVAIENSDLYEKVRQKVRELEQTTDELERANKVKDEFLSIMSHELRTPLNVIMGYLGLVREGVFGEINPEQEDALKKVMTQSTDLLTMVNDVLRATQISGGEIKAQMADVDLRQFLDDLKTSYDILMSKELTVSWDYPVDLPAVETDEEKLRQILQNLVNNAIKFTPKGRVTVSARVVEGTMQEGKDSGQIAESSEQLLAVRDQPTQNSKLKNKNSLLASDTKQRWIEFKVADTGVGIPKEELPLIFEMFRQVDSSETRYYGGVGLGLYIVKNYTELLGGRVKVESRVGQGSAFTITLPCGERGDCPAVSLGNADENYKNKRAFSS